MKTTNYTTTTLSRHTASTRPTGSWLATLAALLVLLGGAPRSAYPQDQSNVLVVEVTEPGFIADGKSIFDAQFTSAKSAPLVVEPYSVRGAFGPVARYYVHGLSGENLTVTAPDHEEKIVSTAGQTFVDIWLGRTKSSPYPTSSRYWQGPNVSSPTPVTAAPFRDIADLFMASSDMTGRIVVSRMDRGPVFLTETSPTGAGIATYNDGLYLAWQGTGNQLVNIMSSSDGARWDNKTTFRETTVARPAIAGGPRQLALVWTGTDRHLNLMLWDGRTWAPKQVLADQSELAPAAIWVRDVLYISWIGSGNHLLNVGRWSGEGFEKITATDTSDDGPSLSMLNGNLAVSWTGKNNHFVNTWTVDTYQGLRYRDKQTFALISDRTPTVLSYRWPSAGDQGVALPLFISSRGTTNTAERYWSGLNQTANTQAEGVVYPDYVVATIIYAPPGTAAQGVKNTIEYGAKSGFGTSLTVANSFKYDNKITAAAGVSAPGANVQTNVTFGVSSSTQDQESTDVRVSTTTSKKYTGPSADGIDHDLDVIVLWLNPQVTVSLTSTDTRWALAPREGQTAVLQEVYVRWLKHPELMPVGVAQALATSHITPAEYEQILAHDPFALTGRPKLNPARFLPASMTITYTPPAAPGLVAPSTEYTESTSYTRTNTATAEQSYSVGLSFSAGFDIGIVKASLKDDETWTWTSKTSRSTTDSSEQTAKLVVAGPSFGYSGPTMLEVYWDSLYRSFAFVPYEPWTESSEAKLGQPAPGASGVLTQEDGSPAPNLEVTLEYADGTVMRTMSTDSGSFEFPRALPGEAMLIVQNQREMVTVGAGLLFFRFHGTIPVRAPQPTNPGFDAGLADWSLWSATSAYRAEVKSRGGQQRYLAQSGGEGVAYRDISGLVPGKRYEISVNLQTSGMVTGRLILHDTREGNYVSSQSESAPSGWRRLSLLYTADATGAVRVHLSRGPNGDGMVMWDDLLILVR